MFLDTEPEDAYDASDRLEQRLDVIRRIVEARAATMDPAVRERRRVEVLRLLANIVVELDEWRVDVDALAEAVA